MPQSKLNNSDKMQIIDNKYVYYDDDLIGKGYSSNVYKGASL